MLIWDMVVGVSMAFLSMGVSVGVEIVCGFRCKHRCWYGKCAWM